MSRTVEAPPSLEPRAGAIDRRVLPLFLRSALGTVPSEKIVAVRGDLVRHTERQRGVPAATSRER